MHYPGVNKFHAAIFATACFYSTSAQPFITHDLKYPITSWQLSSVPRGATDSFGNVLFPEADLFNQPEILFNRAKLAWYSIAPLFWLNIYATPSHIKDNPIEQENHYTREIPLEEVYPDTNTIFSNRYLTFDLAYYPSERGSYNFEHSLNGSAYSAGLDSNGNLNQPATRWGGIMRAINTTDLEAANIRYIVLRLLDPFLYDSNSTGGSLYIQMGNISEDICKDGNRFSESMISCNTTQWDTSVWGIVPFNSLLSPDTFSRDVDERACQDFGLDGMDDADESVFFEWYLDSLQSFLTHSSLQSFLQDLSGDNYHYYRGSDYDSEELGILGRYKKNNNPDGSTLLAGSGQTTLEASHNIPDNEDVNRDHVLSETEEYFQYKIELKPDMSVGQNFITEKFDTFIDTDYPNNPPATWYEFRIPIGAYDTRVGNIPDFKSIRFMRIFLTGFTNPVVLRFAKLHLESGFRVSVPELNHFVKIFPNPNNGKFTIHATDSAVKEIALFNALGQRIIPVSLVSDDSITTFHVDMGPLKGIYFVRIESDNYSGYIKILLP